MEVLPGPRSALGESPLWNDVDGCFYWVDIVGEKVFRLTTRGAETVYRGAMVTALSLMSDGAMLMLTGTGLLALRDGNVEPLVELSLPEGVRPNDGKPDPAGRFWFGTMDLATSRPIGQLFVCQGRVVRVAGDGIILSNGLGWGPDGDVMYHVDSIRRHIYRLDYDPASGVAENRRVLVDLGGVPEVPDGLAVDLDGNLWVAIYDGWRVEVFSPAGQTIHVESLEVQKPTSVAFGGPGLSLLYVTTASQDLDDGELAAQPSAGKVHRLDPGARGLPVGTFHPEA